MKTVAENYAAGFHESDWSTSDPLQDVVMGRIGENLREFYSDTTEAEQPGSLLDLARMLDARLAGDGLDP